MITWKSSKNKLTGTVKSVKWGDITVAVVKSPQGMCYEARFMENTVIGRRGYKEEAKELCEEYLRGLGVI